MENNTNIEAKQNLQIISKTKIKPNNQFKPNPNLI